MKIAIACLVACTLFATAALAEDPPNCVAKDQGGAIIGETNASNAMDCSRKMQSEVRASKCDGSMKGKSFKYFIRAPKTNRDTPQSVRCT